MSIVTAVVLSTLLLTVTGCAFSSDPSTAKQETGKKDPTKKPIKRDHAARWVSENSRSCGPKAEPVWLPPPLVIIRVTAQAYRE